MTKVLKLMKPRVPLMNVKFLRVPLVLAGWMAIANCSTMPGNQPSAMQDGDLASSYAVKSVKTDRITSLRVSKDPRAYYHFLLALKAESQSQFELAASHYKEVVKYDPNVEEMHETLAVLLLRSGQLDELLKACRSSLEQFPDNPALNMALADVLAGRKDYYGAIKHYRKAAEGDPGGSRAYLLMGTVYDALKQYDLAREMYEKVVLTEPSNPLGYHLLSQSQMRQGDFRAAQVSLGKAVSLRPNFIQAREHFAWVLMKLGITQQAIRELKLLVKLDPRNEKVRNYLKKLQNISSTARNTPLDSEELPKDLSRPVDIHMNIAAIFYEQAIYLNALDEFQLALVGEERREPHMLMSRIYEILGRLDKAIEEFEILRKMSPDSVDILRYTARLYSLNEQPNEAVRLIEKAVQLQPENDSLYHSLSLAYTAVEKYDLASESMRTAIRLNDSKDSYYFELGALLERSGKYSDAIENMQRAIEINPMHSNAHNFIGYMYAQEGQYLDKALTHLKKALSIQPRNGYFLDSLGWIYFKKGDSEKALTQIKKAMVYTAPDPVLYDHLGDVQFALKNYDEAHGAWQTSLSLTRVKKDDPDGGEIPDEKSLEEKINKVNRLLRESY
jgi:tetratricopeptide (TPR) repeat protein